MDQLAQVITFPNLAPGVSLAVPHNINVGGRRFVPDLLLRDNLAFTITAATDTQITARNDGIVNATLNTWLQLQHSIERAYGGPANLIPQPFIPGGLVISTGGAAIIEPIAAAHIDSGTGLYTQQSGFVGNPVKNGVGDWTLQYATALDTDVSGIVHATIQDQGGTGQRENITIQSIDNTHIRVRTFQSAALKDEHFWVTIWTF